MAASNTTPAQPKITTKMVLGFAAVVVVVMLISSGGIANGNLRTPEFSPALSDKWGIHVFIPNFQNADLLISNLRMLHRRAAVPHKIQYTVITMEDTLEERNEAQSRIRSAFDFPMEVIHLPQPGVVGGSALPKFFKTVLGSAREDVLVMADTDALMLADNWDARLATLFKDPKMAVAAINPRSGSNEFGGQAEWNWMALRTSVFEAGSDFAFVEGAHDWGQSFTAHALKHGLKQHLWGKSWPLGGIKSIIIAGDDEDPAFVLHTFYGSRRHKELPKDHPEYVAVLSDEERAAAVAWAEDSDHSVESGHALEFVLKRKAGDK